MMVVKKGYPMRLTTFSQRIMLFVTLLAAGTITSGCANYHPLARWNRQDSNTDASIHARAKKDPFPAAHEPPAESVKR